MKPEPPKPVKLFVGILFSDQDSMQKAMSALNDQFGEIDVQSSDFPFDMTDYYQKEMGGRIRRMFVSHNDLIDPGDLADIKLRTNLMEAAFAESERRTVNLDPGYLDFHKVVLASAKYNGQKIYLCDGIYADPTLWYEKGKFCSHKWSFPDFKSGLYDHFFAEVRARYKRQMAGSDFP